VETEADTDGDADDKVDEVGTAPDKDQRIRSALQAAARAAAARSKECMLCNSDSMRQFGTG
jgi:hypothetical protein